MMELDSFDIIFHLIKIEFESEKLCACQVGVQRKDWYLKISEKHRM